MDPPRRLAARRWSIRVEYSSRVCIYNDMMWFQPGFPHAYRRIQIYTRSIWRSPYVCLCGAYEQPDSIYSCYIVGHGLARRWLPHVYIGNSSVYRPVRAACTVRVLKSTRFKFEGIQINNKAFNSSIQRSSGVYVHTSMGYINTLSLLRTEFVRVQLCHVYIRDRSQYIIQVAVREAGQ